MFGMRLRYQIAGFLLLLFSAVVLLMGYFNLSILNDLLARFAFFQAKSNADEVFRMFDRGVPKKTTSLDEYVKKDPAFLDFLRTNENNSSLHNIAVYDSESRLLFAQNTNDDITSDHGAYLRQVICSRIPSSVIWAVDQRKGESAPIETYGILDSRNLYNDYYFPVIREGRLLGIIRISLYLEVATNLLKFFLFGNTSLAFIFVLTAVIAIYLWTENAINRPIRLLLNAQEQLSRGDFNVHVDLDVSSHNELNIIGNSFNRMTKELNQYQEELKQQATEMEKVNLQYRQLNETLEQEVEKKTLEQREFFSLITHDLKIPLAAIKGYTSLLKKDKTGPLNEKQARFVTSIETATVHLLGMVKNMLDSVKYDDGRVNYFMEDFSLITVIREVEDHIHPIIGEKNITFSASIPDECSRVYGDRSKIGQVISNIVGNAINYSPQGGSITLTAQKHDDEVEVRISDTGIGIPAEQLPLIFEKFQRVPNKESPATSLGLGLYIVRKILEGHGMKTWVESEEGKGSSFYFTLKCGEPEGAPPAEEPAPQPAETPTASPFSPSEEVSESQEK